jgi:hypothetical protein
MSRQIDRLIAELVNDDMFEIKKMKKTDLLFLTRCLVDNRYREWIDESIIEEYEERFETHLVKV